MLRITLFLALAALACHAAPASDDEAADQLYKSVIIADYDTALSQSKDLEKSHRGKVITNVVNKLIDEKPQNVMSYGYYLWSNNGQDIVKNYFPIEFRVILSEFTVKIINKRFGMELKLGLSVDSYGDRTAYGDDAHVGPRAVWKFIPVSGSDHKVYFHIYNPHNNQYLKTGNSDDRFGDHEVYGGTASDTFRHQWTVEPVVFNKEILFFIVNRQYGQALKLANSDDSDGDRQAYSHNGDVTGAAARFGWSVVRY